MKLSDLMQATFKNVGEELGLNISVVNDELCVQPKDPSATSGADFIIPTMRMVEKCRCNELDFFRPFIDAGLLTTAQMHSACERYMLGRTERTPNRSCGGNYELRIMN